MKRNYQKELDAILEKIAKENLKEDIKHEEHKALTDKSSVKRLLLHSCCAPCSSYVLVYLRRFFRITVFYYNPNITWEDEYRKRVAEQKRLIAALNAEVAESAPEGVAPFAFPIEVIEGDYEPERFLEAAKGLEKCPEGGERCRKCFELRLLETAKRAKQGGYDYFTTTLTISPLKNAEVLNEVGAWAARQYQVPFLPSDFKKKEGYKQSILLSQKYDLYRQDYCGCAFSKAERDNRKDGK